MCSAFTAWERFKEIIHLYIGHQCKCKKVLVLDGNMKNRRDVCMARDAGYTTYEGLTACYIKCGHVTHLLEKVKIKMLQSIWKFVVMILEKKNHQKGQLLQGID